MSTPSWLVLQDATAVAEEAARMVSDAARRAIAARGRFLVVAAGGSTPRKCHELLAETAQHWSAWQVFIGDERCVPESDPQSNQFQLREALLSRIALPEENLHFPATGHDCTLAARAYAGTLGAYLPFDLVMLGLGEDGHTASLFPGHAHPDDALAVAVHDSPKPPPRRVSMGLGALRATREMLVLATGTGKREAVARWRAGEPDLPIRRATRGLPGHVLLDRDAAG